MNIKNRNFIRLLRIVLNTFGERAQTVGQNNYGISPFINVITLLYNNLFPKKFSTHIHNATISV
jgi:hypothetical protein